MLLPTAHAQTYGNPAKVVRIRTSDRAVREVVRMERPRFGSRAIELRPGEAIAVLDDGDTVVAAAPEPVLVVHADRLPPRTRVILVTAGPYLPVTGVAPLRFSPARTWPPPLPRQPATPTVFRTTEPAVTGTVARSDETAPKDPEPARSSQDSDDAVGQSTSPALTADMVLGFLDDLPPQKDQVSVHFEPAMPQQGTTGSSRP